MAVSRDIYKDDVDFSVLALQDLTFNKQSVMCHRQLRRMLMQKCSLKTNGQLDFSKPEVVQ